ncbi:MAG: nucleotide exchange factor GrpE [Anaerolineales bacterium]
MTTEKSKKQPSQNEDAEQLSFENSSEDAEKDQDESRPQENVVQAEEENTAATESDAQLADVEEDVVELTYEELQEKVESLQTEVERLQKESAEYLDGWQRARAEFANLKKRVEREKSEMRERIISEIISHYLDVLDDYDRALKDRPEENVDEAWIAGLEMIRQKLKAVLESEGVEVIPAEGMDFDPNLHDAISYEDSEEYENGQIIEVIKQGYRLGDRVIRPAVVRVAK